MKPLAMAGLLVIGLGIAGLLLGRFSYTTQEKVIDLGPVTASVEEQHAVHIPDIFAVGAILVGSLMIYLGRKTA